MAELVRVFHNLPVDEAQRLADSLAERRVPLVWKKGNVRRVLDPEIPLRSQILILLASTAEAVSVDVLRSWCDYENSAYFKKLLRGIHTKRLV